MNVAHAALRSVRLNDTGLEVEEVPIAELRFGLSPRLEMHDRGHAATLAEVLPQLPPILVHAPTMRVIDGVHRVQATRLCGRDTVRAVFFHGTEAEALIKAVQSNTTHGKPLTLAERTAAATKILRSHPDWSDRRIAEVCGVSAKKVAQLRTRATAETPQLRQRVGRDGKARPVDPIQLRHQIAEALSARPAASVGEIARQTGGSEGTVRDVRLRLERGDDILSPRQALTFRRRQEEQERKSIEDDESYRTSPAGEEFTAWFTGHVLRDDSEWERFVDRIPMGRIYEVADEARRSRDVWQRFVTALEARARRRRPS